MCLRSWFESLERSGLIAWPRVSNFVGQRDARVYITVGRVWKALLLIL